jgi:hypothetical protein
MSVSPSIPQGAPSLAEVLITRTFAKPTNPFVDDGESPVVAAAESGSGTRIDVRV